MKRIGIIALMASALVMGVSCDKDNEPVEEPVFDPSYGAGILTTHDGHAFVDLGLSVKWATCNVGAKQSTELGNFYAWGETETYYDDDYEYVDVDIDIDLLGKFPWMWKYQKEGGYDWVSYKYCNGKECTMTKYCTTSLCGTVDNKTTLESGDDAASANWGGDWRTPTYSELKELYNSGKCTWKWYASGNTEFGGVAGWKITSKVPEFKGNFIFLPNAGTAFIKDHSNVGTDGYYMSSSLSHDNGSYKANNDAHILYMSDHSYVMSFSSRCTGISVRPVFK